MDFVKKFGVTSIRADDPELVQKIKSLQLNPSILEELVQIHYQENRKIVSLDGHLMRMALQNNISRDLFLKYYLGNEINPNFQKFLKENQTWRNFFNKLTYSFIQRV